MPKFTLSQNGVKQEGVELKVEEVDFEDTEAKSKIAFQLYFAEYVDAVPDSKKPSYTGSQIFRYVHSKKYEIEHLSLEQGYEVPVSGFGIGKFLLSRSFATCQPVVAILSGGQNVALYHASAYHAYAHPFNKFIQTLLANGVERVMLFEKTPRYDMNIEAYSRRADMLQSDLQVALNRKIKRANLTLPGAEIKLIPVERYKVDPFHSVLIDGTSRKIFLSDSDDAHSQDPEEKLVQISPVPSCLPGWELVEAYLDPVTSSRSDLLTKEKSLTRLKHYTTIQIQSRESDTTQLILNLIDNEIHLLASQKPFCCFNPGSGKAKQLLSARMIVEAAELKVTSQEDLSFFLEFKMDKQKSIKEALEINPYRCGTSPLYRRFLEKAEAIIPRPDATDVLALEPILTAS